ncbi:hypothetical protein [Terricaulis sp.]|uniref:hypothetical protein n=1 Tax=Terricaulis sp. TaxID=2768686 RepID=UPI0037849096
MIASLTHSAWRLCAALLLVFFIAAPAALAQPNSANSSGRWNATFHWDGAEPGNGVFVLNPDGTFAMEDFQYTGRWNVRGNTFWLRIEQPPNTVYSGAFQSDGSISGTLRNNEGRTGTFTFTRAAASASGYLPENFDAGIARQVLGGDNEALLGAFVFEGTPQGHSYWYSLYESRGPLPAAAQAQLREWIARAEAQGGGSTGGKGGTSASASGGWHAIAGDWELIQNLQGNTCSRYYRFTDRGAYLDWYTGENTGALGQQTDASNFRDVGGGRIFYEGYDDQYFQLEGSQLVRTNAGGTRYCTFRRR